MTPIVAQVVAWAAWAPGLESQDNWKNWLQEPWQLGVPDEIPELSYLPTLFKRRLGQLSKMVLQVGHTLALNDTNFSCVLASSLGEIQQQLKITSKLLSEDDVSPSAFSLSVFNTSVALLSISEKIHAGVGAVAASDNTAEFGILDAVSRLKANPEQDLVLIFADESVPALYDELVQESKSPYAIGLRLRASATNSGAGEYMTVSTEGPSPGVPINAWKLLRAMLFGGTSMGVWSAVSFESRTS